MRKRYEAIAKAISESYAEVNYWHNPMARAGVSRVIYRLRLLFKADDPHFDGEQFDRLCRGVKE